MAEERVIKEAELVETKTAPTSQSSIVANANSKEDTMGLIAIILSVINLCAWFIPICGCPMSVAAIVLAVLGMKSTKYGVWVKVALGVSIIALIAALINGIWGGIIGYQNASANL